MSVLFSSVSVGVGLDGLGFLVILVLGLGLQILVLFTALTGIICGVADTSAYA